MISPLCSVALCAAVASSGAPPMGVSPGTFFVSLDGRDEWSGALPAPNRDGSDGPFRTLARARDALRSADRSLSRRAIVRAGTYCLDAPLILGPQDLGTAAHPVTYMAYPGEKVVLSGGARIVEWTKRDGGVWSARLPEAAAAVAPRQMRLGEEMQTLARHPNAEPDRSYTGGWLFARIEGKVEGDWGGTVANIHTPGDWIEWDVDVPQAGEYSVWVYYGAQNRPHGRTDMADRTTLQVDGGEDVWLQSLPDTGSWSAFKWSRCAALRLSTGRHTLRWTNRKGGGLNLDAFALCTDPEWTPKTTELPKPAPGAHLIVFQAEAYDRAQGKEMTRSPYTGRPDRLPFARGDIPADWDLGHAQIMIFPAWGWVGGPMQITGVDHYQGFLFLDNKRGGADISLGNRYYLQNVREALDQPGEFFVDDDAGEVLYIPTDGEFREREAVVPVHDRIIHIRGDAEAGMWAEHIHIRGISFRDTTYSKGLASLYTQPEGAVWLEHARGCVIEDCTFSQLGGYAVHMLAKTNQCQVLGCRIFDMGGGGVLTTGNTADQPTACTVAGCHMHHLGRVYKHCAGVYVTTGSGHRVAHNTITDVPRYGISFKSFGGDAWSHDNIAEYNELLRTNLETNDTGAIETLGRDRQHTGNIIRYNLILDVVGMKHTDEGGIITPHYTWGIYLDDYSSGTTVFGNIVARTVRGGYHNHLGFDNVVENNVFVDGKLYQFEYNGGAEMRNNVFRRNIVVFSDSEAVYCRASGWERAVLRECDSNVIWWTGGDLATTERGITPEGPWAKWLAAGFDTRSVIADPQFVARQRDDYRLRPGSPALELGFEPIPVEQIGVRGYRELREGRND